MPRCLLILLAAASVATSQRLTSGPEGTASISGVVRDAVTGKVLPGVRLKCGTHHLGSHFLTGSLGEYKLNKLYAGRCDAVATLDGFEAATRRFTVEPGQ